MEIKKNVAEVLCPSVLFLRFRNSFYKINLRFNVDFPIALFFLIPQEHFTNRSVLIVFDNVSIYES